MLLDRVLRDRELELFFFLDPEDRDEDVLLLRDPGGEDVRVAMLRPYGQVTPATGITPCVSPCRALRPPTEVHPCGGRHVPGRDTKRKLFRLGFLGLQVLLSVSAITREWDPGCEGEVILLKHLKRGQGITLGLAVIAAGLAAQPLVGAQAAPASKADDSVVSRLRDAASGSVDLRSNPVGAGPFMVETFNPPDSVKLVKWDGYFEADRIRLAGIEFVNVSPDPNAQYGSLVLLKYLGRGPSPAGEVFLGFTTGDLSGLLERVRKAGGAITAPIHEMPERKLLVAFATDPEGHLAELVQLVP